MYKNVLKVITNDHKRNISLIEDTFISEKSKYNDPIWDFTQENRTRKNSVNNSKLRIKWSEYNEISPKLIKSVKVVCYFLLKHPNIMAKRNNTRRGYKENTIVSMCDIFLRFLNSIVVENSLQSIIINSDVQFQIELEDLTITMFQKQSLTSKSYINPIKSMLKAFCNPIVRDYINTNVNWNIKDIDNITFKIKPRGTITVSYSDQPIEDSLFILLSKNATYDVLTFLDLMNLESDYNKFGKVNMSPNKDSQFPKMFKAYCELQNKGHNLLKTSEYRSPNSYYYKKFKNEYRISVKEFKMKLDQYHKAAIVILCLFTGVRYSELISFKTNCLNEIKKGLWVLRGTITKNEHPEQKEDDSEWIACPIVRDAVKVLEWMTKFSTKTFLVSSTNCNNEDTPYSNKGLNYLLNSYKNKIDVEQKFSHPRHNLSTHRFRHSLARQLIKANLSIPYISDHLKHIHSQITLTQNYISNVTTGYGYISKDLFNNATLINDVKKEIVYDIYHPESPIAGKNSEEFKNKRRDYFQGMIAEGWTISEIMEHLQQKGVPFSDVGLGYCGGKRTIELKNGQKEVPPCIGQLQCNPNRCHNAVIPSSKIPHWKNVYYHNKRMLNNPDFNHLKNEHETAMKEAETVLKLLNVNLEVL